MNKKTKIFLAITVMLALFMAPFASSLPDGLERVAHDLGFVEMEAEPLFEVLPDYQIPFIESEGLGTALSGLAGLLLCLLIVWAYARLGTLVRTMNKREEP
ncbi:PDGLE domain-containing protein [Ammoniphilus sp. YIM 78166]|uniref:PDGLE domain-containing protein n=1 Tax=Ammoniphilus sp. YIM 78166 TaxID=1644106 RepID=UPI00106F8B17|nr:PDGLE domain-containing protein [Ammoniphilus sp. YIM 78166]